MQAAGDIKKKKKKNPSVTGRRNHGVSWPRDLLLLCMGCDGLIYAPFVFVHPCYTRVGLHGIAHCCYSVHSTYMVYTLYIFILP